MHQRQRAPRAAGEAHEQQQQAGPDEVELLLHGERPEVQQRRLAAALRRGSRCPRSRTGCWRRTGRRRSRRRARSRLRQAVEHEPAGDQRDDDDQARRGQQPTGAARPEVRERDGAGGGQLAQQQRGDEEAGEHEEHVDADEAAATRARTWRGTAARAARRPNAGLRCRAGTFRPWLGPASAGGGTVGGEQVRRTGSGPSWWRDQSAFFTHQTANSAAKAMPTRTDSTGGESSAPPRRQPCSPPVTGGSRSAPRVGARLTAGCVRGEGPFPPNSGRVLSRTWRRNVTRVRRDALCTEWSAGVRPGT